MNMTKEKKISYYVEGPNWETNVYVDGEIHDDERSQLLEAGTLAIEKRILEEKKEEGDLQVSAVLTVKKNKKSTKEALVNTYICLVNAGHYKIAENLRETFKKETGNDLASDEKGFSY
jgi:hypothetical protein